VDATATLSLGKQTPVPITLRLDGPQILSGILENRIFFFQLPGIEPQFFSHYTHWASFIDRWG